MNSRAFLPAATALIVAIFIAATLIVQPLMRGARIDFTENGLYTLSDGTRSVLSSLEEPVDLTFVYTRQVGQEFPAIRAYATRVREMLDAYKAVAGSKLRIREIDPEPFSEAEDEALASGIRAVNSDGGDPLYFGLIGRNTVDDERVISFLAPEQEETLEYDLTRLIARLDRPEPATIGVLSMLQGMSGDGQDSGYTLLQEMARSYQVQPIENDFFALPEDMDVLVMVHPPALNDWQAWLVDQFILRTGRVIMLVDPAAKTSQGSDFSGLGDRQIRSDLGRFGDVWGVHLSEEALADTETALPIQSDAGEGRTTVVRHPLYLSATPQQMSSESLITADLSRSVNFGAPGGLILDEESPFDTQTLIETGPAPSWIPPDRAVTDLNPQDTLELYEPLDQALPLAVRVHGAMVSAFPDGEPEPAFPEDPVVAELARAEAEKAKPHITTSERDAEILIVSDADMVDDGLYVNLQDSTAFADNGAFLMNALDVMSGDANLLSLRARSSSRRPMTRVDKMRDAAQARYFDEQERLEENLAQSQARLEELQTRSAGDGFFEGNVEATLTEEEQTELARLRQDIVETRSRLRTIEREFRQEIDSLEGWLKFINIFGGPVLIGLLGGLVWWRRRRKVTV
ncbi:Gldg family protein [Henriciella aquimarina]|uniref:GldG family protein n=1 Tax=Henriciella aquimarina TaxID=545261 RepID=UPI0009FD772C|nr:Gldg family protein [Henriciella aquimarina]